MNIKIKPTKFIKVFIWLFLIHFSIFGAEEIAHSKVSNLIKENFPKNENDRLGLIVIKNDKLVHFKGYGDGVNADTKFSLASVSKQFAAMCAAILIEEKLLNMEKEVSYYLPDIKLQFKGRPLKIKDLIWHTSGLVNFINKNEKESIGLYQKKHGIKYMTNKTHAEWLMTQNVKREPGVKYEYTNSGYVLLARVIEVLAKKPYWEYQKEKLFDPLGMKHTSGSKRFNGSGNMLTTMNDFSTWIKAVLNKDERVAKAKTWEMVFTQGKFDNGDKVPYGFGWKFKDCINHGGSGPGETGSRNMVQLYLEEKSAVVMFRRGVSFNTKAREDFCTSVFKATK